MSEQGFATFLTVFASLTILFVNDGLIRFVRRFSLFEKHQTVTKIDVSVALKLAIARFLNQSIILVLVNENTKRWFEGGSLASDASILMISGAF